jgi:hypothetical protein
MILHCVFMRFPEGTATEAIERHYRAVAALKPLIAGLLEVRAGPNVSTEGLHHGFVHGFTVTFADAGARDAYLVHPEHAKVGAAIVAATAGGTDGVLVYDLEI